MWRKPEELLRRHGLYQLDGYLGYWKRHNTTVLDSVPADRLLVVRTDRLTQEAFGVADFAGLPRDTVQLAKSHTFRNPEKFHILDQIEPHYLEEKIGWHCAPLISRFFAKRPDVAAS